MISKFAIAGRAIGLDHPPYVIAELSANHNGQFDMALRIIAEAKKAGADAVKIQTYRPDTITLDSDSDEFRIRGGLWDGRTRSEEHTSELQSLMRISYAVFCLKNKKTQ